MAHYYDEKTVADHQIRLVKARYRGIDFEFETDRGVFSRNGLDYGSNLLIETVLEREIHPMGGLLDLGCGYGPVGIVFKRSFPALEVVMCDVNQRALALAKKNAAHNQVRYIDIIQSDGLHAIKDEFDLILTNPPIRAGKATVHRFFAESFTALKPGGRLYVVIQKKQGAPSAESKLTELFGRCERVNHSAGYWILEGIKLPTPV